jgi:hypothetical protein
VGRRFDPDRAHRVLTIDAKNTFRIYKTLPRGSELCAWYFSAMALKIESVLASTLFFGLFATATLVTPWHNLEPSVLPKLSVLSIITCVIGVLFFTFKNPFSKFASLFTLCFLMAISLSILNLLINSQFISERVLGIQGRNFGALAFICLLLTSIIAFSLSEKIDSKKLMFTVKFSSFIVAIYFIAQLNGLDIAAWVDAYNGIPSSTLGNPNFVAAFVSIGFVSTLPLLVSKQIKLSLRILLFSISALELYVSIMSDSFQGLAIIFLGSLYTFLSLVIPLVVRLQKTLSAAATTLFLFIVVFSTLRFRDYLSVDLASIRARIDYWEAGVAMGFDSPIFGKGFDYFGESYFLFRSEGAAIRGFYSNSAHNYFVDLLAFGGIPLLLTSLLPMILVLLKGSKFLLKPVSYLENKHGESAVIRGLLLAWLGFFTQANLSPFNIALAYLGFLLSGFLYGILYESAVTSEQSKHVSQNKVIGREVFTSSATKRRILLVVMIPLLFSIPIFGIQALVADARFRDGIEQGNGDAIYRIALNQPKNFQRMAYAAQIFIQNERQDLAIPIIRDMVKENPAKIAGWRLLEQVSTTEAEKSQIRAKILSLDPRNLEANSGSESKK